MRGAVPPSPYVFMTLCLIKTRDNFVFPVESECLVPSNFLLCSPAQPIKVSCAHLFKALGTEI
jgi:hypothetical protein